MSQVEAGTDEKQKSTVPGLIARLLTSCYTFPSYLLYSTDMATINVYTIISKTTDGSKAHTEQGPILTELRPLISVHWQAECSHPRTVDVAVDT